MKTFVIDKVDRVHPYSSIAVARRAPGEVVFTTRKEFEAAIKVWPAARLLAIWNQLPGAKPVGKFRDRRTALRRIWLALEEIQLGRSTNTAVVIGLRPRPGGASIAEIMMETGWKAHSVRALISATISKRLGFNVSSDKTEGERMYRIR
jgi:hypothetical protein